jgi:hypothetical protein
MKRPAQSGVSDREGGTIPEEDAIAFLALDPCGEGAVRGRTQADPYTQGAVVNVHPDIAQGLGRRTGDSPVGVADASAVNL